MVWWQCSIFLGIVIYILRKKWIHSACNRIFRRAQNSSVRVYLIFSLWHVEKQMSSDHGIRLRQIMIIMFPRATILYFLLRSDACLKPSASSSLLYNIIPPLRHFPIGVLSHESQFRAAEGGENFSETGSPISLARSLIQHLSCCHASIVEASIMELTEWWPHVWLRCAHSVGLTEISNTFI